MSISLVGAVFLVAGIALWFTTPRLFVLVLSAAAALPTTAAVTIGESSVPPFYVVAVIATISAVVSAVRGVRVGHLSVRLLMWFVGWSVLVTAVAPALFAGLLVLDPRGGIDEQVTHPTPLGYSVSMAAQVVYLILAAGVVLYLAQLKTLDPGYLTPGFALGTGLSILRLVPGLAPLIDWLFRNYASAAYNDAEPRHFGSFAEPSYLAVFSIAALVYVIYRAPRVKGWRRLGIVAMGAGAIVNLVASGSGTAALSVLVLVVIAIVYYGWRLLVRDKIWQPAQRRQLWLDMREHGVRTAIVVTVAVLAGVALVVPNPLRDMFWGTIWEKAASLSFLNRTASDLRSVEILFQTFGLGVGLGANRPSSFATLLLSSVGVVGTLLFVALVAVALWRARRMYAWAPVLASLIALLVAKVVAEPALSTPMLWMALGGTVFAGAAAVVPRRSPSIASPREDSAPPTL